MRKSLFTVEDSYTPPVEATRSVSVPLSDIIVVMFGLEKPISGCSGSAS